MFRVFTAILSPASEKLNPLPMNGKIKESTWVRPKLLDWSSTHRTGLDTMDHLYRDFVQVVVLLHVEIVPSWKIQNVQQ